MTKIDALKLVDFYLDGYGVSLDFVKDNDEVQQILQKQAQQQQEVMDQQNMAMGAKTQKDLAQAQEAEANAQIE
jgi:Mg/Co/Ni transporter MgtE